MSRKSEYKRTATAPAVDPALSVLTAGCRKQVGPKTMSIRRKIRSGFLLVVLLTVLTGGGLAIHLTHADRSMPIKALSAGASPENGDHDRLLIRVRFGLLGGTLLALTALGTIYMFLVRHVLHPLEYTAEAARQLADGHLDATVPIQDADEIGRIGEMINDMGVNLQELILLIWNQTGNALDTIEGINNQLDKHNAVRTKTEIRASLQLVRQNLGTMQTVARSFDLYDVLLAGKKAVAMEDLVDRVN
ncbi:MAG: HAMP domain-containing protein [Desulfosarcina sp.]|nr:HAMP domain-containing protein [Desulfobacterales bacterium]